ncbi:MAG: septum formation initiator family protein [Myxococcota bacterium]
MRLCALTVLLLLGAAASNVPRHAQLLRDLRRMRSDNHELMERNRQLEAEIRGLRHLGPALEGKVRDELGWIRPREAILLFSD